MNPSEYIFIDTANQRLILLNQGQVIVSYPISTARNGLGEEQGSEKTPRGWHKIRAKIGSDAAVNTVFKARRPTGEIYSQALATQYPHRDWILTRILWLSGLEPGFNRLGQVDTMRRFIYIHGCPDEVTLDQPLSHGCIRMHNRDLIDLYDRVPVGIKVYIGEALQE